MKIKIDKNVPIPKSGKGTGFKYPLGEMKVGDSFFVRDIKIETVSSSVSLYKKKSPGKNFTVRTIEGGVRVWRTE